MLDGFLELFTSSLKVFSEERRRHFSKELRELQDKVDEENAKRFPHFNRDRLFDAQRKLRNFKVAYSKEFDREMLKLLTLKQRQGDTGGI